MHAVAGALAMMLSSATIISAITSTLFPGPDTSLGFGGTAIVGVAAVGLWIARSVSTGRRYERGAWLTICVIDFFLLGMAPRFPAVSSSLAVGFAVPVLCATVFLAARGTIGVFALSLVCGTTLLTATASSVTEFSFVFGILFTVTALTVQVAFLREEDLRNIERLRAFERRDAERLGKELELAQRVQAAMLPEMPETPALDVAAFTESAHEASGDFYDVFEVVPSRNGSAPRLGIVICDVAGKGVAAALIMSTTRAALRSAAERTSSPSAVLQRVNAMLAASLPNGLFVTLFYGVFDPIDNILTYCSGGHPHPYHWRAADAELAELESFGMPLGLVADSTYEPSTTVLQPGDFILLYTDGLVEALDGQRQMLGFDRVHDDLRAGAARFATAEERVKACLATMRDFIGEERLHDDVTIVALVVPRVDGAVPLPADIGLGHER